jgi:hypothetical protein
MLFLQEVSQLNLTAQANDSSHDVVREPIR